MHKFLTPYSVGDYVIYNDLMYKCNTEITSAEVFDPNKWDEVSVAEELVSIKSNTETLDSIKANSSIIAPTESSTTATRNYAAGDYLILNNILYQVTATISSGQTIASGTNVTAANTVERQIGDVENAIKSSVIFNFAENVTWVDGYYIHYLTGEIVENQYYSYFVTDVTDVFRLSITSYFSSIGGVVFKDENGNYITGYHHGQGEYTDVVDVPKDAKYLYVSCISQYKSIAAVDSDIKTELNYVSSRLYTDEDLIDEKVTAQRTGTNISNTVENGIIKTDLTLYTTGSSNKHSNVSIEYSGMYRVSCYSANSNYPGAFYINDNIVTVLLGGTSKTYDNVIIEIPDGINTLYLNGSTNAILPEIFYIPTERREYSTPNLFVAIYEDTSKTLKTVTKSGMKDLITTFSLGGGNNLPDFRKFEIVDNSNSVVGTKLHGTSILSATSDWFAPFVVQAVNNDDGDKPSGYGSHFTGGNHEYTNTGVGGTPTARCSSLKYYVDGHEVTSFIGYANCITATWTNFVQGNNTKKEDGTGREILQENHTLEFDGQQWSAWVELVPLEDISMIRWYGLQCPHLGTATTLLNYVGAANRLSYEGNEDSNSGNKDVSEIRIQKPNLEIVLGVDTTYDCGRRDYYSGTSGAFNVGSSKKSYFWIIQSLSMGREKGIIFADAIASPPCDHHNKHLKILNYVSVTMYITIELQTKGGTTANILIS